MKKSALSWKLRSACSLIAVFCAFRFPALSEEGIHGLLRLADSLAVSGLRSESAVEYRRAICFSSDSDILCRAYYGLGLQYRYLGEFEKAGNSFESAAAYAPNDSLIGEIKLSWAGALICAGKMNLAKLMLFPVSGSAVPRHARLQSRLLLFICAVRQHQWSEARAHFSEYVKMDPGPAGHDSFCREMDGVLSAAESKTVYSPAKSKLLSVFLPGLGQVYSGDLRSGINAFILNSLNFWAVALNVVRADYAGAVLYFLFIAERYYSGNLYRAEECALRANAGIDEKFEKLITGKLQRLPVPAGRE